MHHRTFHTFSILFLTTCISFWGCTSDGAETETSDIDAVRSDDLLITDDEFDANSGYWKTDVRSYSSMSIDTLLSSDRLITPFDKNGVFDFADIEGSATFCPHPIGCFILSFFFNYSIHNQVFIIDQYGDVVQHFETISPIDFNYCDSTEYPYSFRWNADDFVGEYVDEGIYQVFQQSTLFVISKFNGTKWNLRRATQLGDEIEVTATQPANELGAYPSLTRKTGGKSIG